MQSASLHFISWQNMWSGEGQSIFVFSYLLYNQQSAKTIPVCEKHNNNKSVEVKRTAQELLM